MGKSTISMAIFNSYVSLPEAMFFRTASPVDVTTCPPKESKKDFPLSVGMLMAYLQAESLSNSGRYFATWQNFDHRIAQDMVHMTS